MNLLVTNDDGIASPFLHELVAALRLAGHTPYVAAPKTEQSWVGAGKSRDRAIHATAADRGLGCPTWIIDGTPSDCVNIALDHLIPRTTAIDAVLSGINIGFNASLGFIIASGTIAGAWEGALHGLPALAFSQALTEEAYNQLKASADTPDADLLVTLRHSAAHAARLTAPLIGATAPHSFVVHNINFPLPCGPTSLVHRTIPARVVIPRLYSPACPDGNHRLIFRAGEDLSANEPLTDRAALAAGHISHTTLDYTRLGH